MIISMIAAMANNRVIGLDNKMPWHLPADLQHFKKVTTGKPIITRNSEYTAQGIEVVTTPDAALELVTIAEEVMIIGGGNIYEQFLPKAERLYLTFIDLDVKGDTQFPDYNKVANWYVKEEQENHPDDKNLSSYKFVTLYKER